MQLYRGCIFAVYRVSISTPQRLQAIQSWSEEFKVQLAANGGADEEEEECGRGRRPLVCDCVWRRRWQGRPGDVVAALQALPPGRRRRNLHDDCTAVVLFLDGKGAGGGTGGGGGAAAAGGKAWWWPF
jgi:hypothetical protein